LGRSHNPIRSIKDSRDHFFPSINRLMQRTIEGGRKESKLDEGLEGRKKMGVRQSSLLGERVNEGDSGGRSE